LIYREDPRLGALKSSHAVKGSSYLGASIFGVVLAAGFGWWSTSDESLKPGVGALVMLGLSFTFFREWLRIRTMVLDVHEGGISMRNASGQRIDFLFDEVLILEARYVPGMFKKGLADEGNRVSLHVFDAKSHVSLPREMDGFSELGPLLSQKTGLTERRVLIENASAR
jgi:hypothetical protein